MKSVFLQRFVAKGQDNGYELQEREFLLDVSGSVGIKIVLGVMQHWNNVQRGHGVCIFRDVESLVNGSLSKPIQPSK